MHIPNFLELGDAKPPAMSVDEFKGSKYAL